MENLKNGSRMLSWRSSSRPLRNKKPSFWSAVSLALLTLGSCNARQDKTDPLIEGENPPTFSIVHEKILKPRCLTCHNHTWCDTYQGVKRRVDDIERVAIRERTMPKGNPLSTEETDLLERWIKGGAPEGPSVPEKPKEPLKPSFESIKTNILTQRCLHCHSTGHPGAQVPMETREDLINSPRDLVIPGNPDESGLILSITRSDSKKMPPPDSGIPAFTTAEINVIRQWILDGAGN